MTTIALKDGIMACDSCWTDANGLQSTSATKMTRLRSRALIGEAGDNDSRAVLALLQNVSNFSQMPTCADLASTKTEYHAVIAFQDGDVAQIIVEQIDGNYRAQVFKVNRHGIAVGTGAQVATGAMDAGKSAAQAVAIACRRDPNSRLPVHIEPVKQARRKRKSAG
jgi:hypothetical protein